MKYAFYPGCVPRAAVPQLYSAAVKVADKLDLELEEMSDVSCTGAGCMPTQLSDPINARTFAKAEQMGLPIMTICSTCQGVFSQANDRLQNPSTGKRSIASICRRGLSYQGTTEVKHMLWVLFEDYGMEKLKPLISLPSTV